jgi:hypothetical protein
MQADVDSTTKGILRGFAAIASWQFAAFALLLLLIWANELFDLPAWVYDQAPREPNIFAASLLSAFVLATAILTVGQTYAKQKELLAGMITVCLHCHKVRLDDDAWEAIERYLSTRMPVEFSHGFCPECFAEEMAAIAEYAKSEKTAAALAAS